MGTSGAFGGSGSADWKAAHDLFGAAAGASGADSAGPSSPAEARPSPADVAQAIAAAFQSGDAALRRTQVPEFPLGRLLTRSNSRSGGGGDAGGSGGGVRSGSRQGGAGQRGGRSMQHSAARGAAAVAGAFALRSGDAAALGELGLRLADLRTLTVSEQCQLIADDVLGAPNHPDDVAVRKASIATMRSLLQATTPMSEDDVLRLFLAHLVTNTSMVELKSKQQRESLSPKAVLRVERQVQKYITQRVKKVRITALGRFSPQRFVNRAAQFATEALHIIRRA